MTSVTKNSRYRLYLPSSPYPSRIRIFDANDGARVQGFKDEACIRWSKSLKGVDDDEVFLLKCEDVPCDPLETLFERVLIWLRKRSVHDAMIEGEKLSMYFPNGPAREEDRKIDIIVATTMILDSPEVLYSPADRHATKLTQERLKLTASFRNIPSPSECVQGIDGVRTSNDEGRGIHAHRPASNYGPPAALFQPALARLKHRLDHLDQLDELEPRSELLEECHSFIFCASKVYEVEYENRGTRVTELKYLVDSFLKETELWEYRTSSKAEWGHPVFLLLEGKNEDGLGGNATLQAVMSFVNTLSRPSYKDVIARSNCPIILIGLMGPRLEISTAVFTDGIYVDKLLSQELYLDAWQADRVLRLGRVLTAVALSAVELQEHYKKALQDPNPAPTARHLYPDPVSAAEGTRIPELRYLGKLTQFGRCVGVLQTDERNGKRNNHENELENERPYARYVAKMTLENEPGHEREVVVKFVTRYNERAHRLLAGQGLAPKLHFYTPVLGDLSMVVMDYVRGDRLDFATIPLDYSHIYNNLETAVKLLHAEDIVFGDLRLQNVILNSERNAVLVDFDWAGRHGMDKYPASLNDGATWADGVARRAVMLKAHDVHQLRMLKLFLEGAKGKVGMK